MGCISWNTAPPRDLSADEIRAYIERCPEQNRWAFAGWLRGERELDGDLVQQQATR